MTERSSGVTLDYGSGGTSVINGVAALDAELDTIYGHLNTIASLNPLAAPPASPGTNEVYFDTALLAVRWWDGDSWVTIASPTAHGSGLTLDAATLGHTRGMLLTAASATAVQIAGSATVPSSIEIGGLLLLNTANTPMAAGHTFAGAAAGNYAVFATRDGTTTNYALGRAAAAGFTPAATQRAVGLVCWSGTAISWIQSNESRLIQVNQMPLGMFLASRYSVQQAIATTYTQLLYETVRMDVDGGFSSSVFTAQRAGWYEISVQSKVFNAAPITEHGVAIHKDGVQVANCTNNDHSIEGGANRVSYARASAYIYLAVGSVISGHAKATPASTTTSANMHDNSIWGRWIGSAFGG